MLLKYRYISVLDILCVLLLFRTTIVEYTYLIIARIPIIGQYSAFIVQIVLLILFMLSIRNINKKLSAYDYIFYIVTVLIILIHYTLFINNAVYLEEIINKIIFNTLPYYFIGRLLDYNKIDKIVIFFTYASISIFIFIRFILHTNEDFNYEGGDMGGAFTILPLIILLSLYAYETKKIIPTIITVCGFILLIMLGNRGSLLYAISFITLIFFKNFKNITIWGKIVIIIVLVLIITYSKAIMLMIGSNIEQYGFSMRILDFIDNSNISDSSGRYELWSCIFESLKDNIWGLGITGDRLLLNGMYSHNVFIEIFSSFGFIVGTILNVLLIYVLIKAYRCVRNQRESNFYIAMICFGLLPLLTSMSFIEYHYFFILIGYSIGLIKRYSGITNKKTLFIYN